MSEMDLQKQINDLKIALDKEHSRNDTLDGLIKRYHAENEELANSLKRMSNAITRSDQRFADHDNRISFLEKDVIKTLLDGLKKSKPQSKPEKKPTATADELASIIHTDKKLDEADFIIQNRLVAKKYNRLPSRYHTIVNLLDVFKEVHNKPSLTKESIYIYCVNAGLLRIEQNNAPTSKSTVPFHYIPTAKGAEVFYEQSERSATPPAYSAKKAYELYSIVYDGVFAGGKQ